MLAAQSQLTQRLSTLRDGVRLGRHRLRNNIALAPMAGLSDVPFRTLAWRYGAGYMVSEMVSDKPELWETGKSRLRRVPVPGVEPVAVQIAGTDPKVMAAAASRHAQEGVDIIDINFGCPAKKVCKKAAGSALLADLEHLGSIVAAVVDAVDVPVTVKTRTGLVPGDDAGVQAATVAAAAGAAMVVMHARSRACKFQGEVDYRAVARARAAIDVPLLVNGDIRDATSASRALEVSGAQGVMVGRAALGQPWLFARLCGGPEPCLEEKWQVVAEHLGMMHAFYGVTDGTRIARKHIAAYFTHLGCAAATPAFMKIRDAAAQRAFIDALRRQQLGRSTHHLAVA